MAEALVAHLSARFVFVVGKGGVGKSTTAAALSLAFADRGHATRVLSTDPAHSLGDLFGGPLDPDRPSLSPCTPLLSIEEFDASRRARQWLAEVEGPVGDLIERGTYLDRDDVADLLGCSVPGMDEVMAAMRISELALDTEQARVVVDTAPTGHTLRLLDCGEILAGWATAVGAMASKAGAVAYGLTGRRPRFAGEAVIERLRAAVSRFTETVLADADFVVVTRADDVVKAETARLLADLRDRGLHVRALVVVGGGRVEGGGDVPVVEVETVADLAGCAGLRAWGALPSHVDPERLAPTEPPAGDAVHMLRPRRLMLFAGKGGVGKSTCAAAYAVAVADTREVLLLSTDPAGSLGDVFGREVSSEGTTIGPRLVARQLDADAEYARFRGAHREKIRQLFENLGLRDSAPLDRAVLESIIDMAPPGLDEIFGLEAILDGPGDRDVLILDTAPTGHFLRLLQMPETALAWTRALLRVLIKYRSVLGLDGLAQDLLVWARRLKSLLELLGDDEHTGVVIVSLPEALSLRETDRLLASLDQGRIPVAAVIRNRWAPNGSSTGGGPAASSPHPTILSPLLSTPPVGLDALRAFGVHWANA